MKTPRQASGDAAEQAVADEAQKRGYKVLCRNYRCRRGELDLILAGPDGLVITEVRLRRNTRFGSGADSVDARKQQRIVHATQQFLAENTRWRDSNIRFDVVSLDKSAAIHWIENAFLAE